MRALTPLQEEELRQELEQAEQERIAEAMRLQQQRQAEQEARRRARMTAEEKVRRSTGVRRAQLRAHAGPVRGCRLGCSVRRCGSVIGKSARRWRGAQLMWRVSAQW